MHFRNHTFPIALGLSLLLHLALLAGGMRYLTRTTTVPNAPVWINRAVVQVVADVTTPAIRWGERGGEGVAMNTFDSPDEQRAAFAPVDSAPQTLQEAQQAPATPSPDRASETSTQAIQRVDSEDFKRSDSGFRVRDALATSRAKPPQEQPTKIEHSESAPPADRDADAFSSKEGMDFNRGGLSARGGREFKFRRPEVDLAFRADVTKMGLPIGTLLRVRIDKTGSPLRVDVVRSSNSLTIDQNVKVAAYASWFEPIEPLEFDFGVTFR